MNNNPSHTDDRFEELCAAYVLNALDAEERDEFIAMLEAASDEQLETYHALRSVANQLAFTAERAEPSESVIQRILEQIQREKSETVTPITEVEKEEKEEESGYSRTALAVAASFALLVITVALVFYSFNLNSDLNSKQDTIEQQQVQITELKKEMQRKEQMLSILSARNVDMVLMNGLDVNPNGYGKVIWDADKQQALLQVSNLPPIPQNKDYQLWLIKNNKPLPSGVFSVSRTGKNAFFKIEKMASANEQNANAFAVTLEPKGGSQQPTGDMYLLGNLNKNSQ